jgi:hypothetical protein
MHPLRPHISSGIITKVMSKKVTERSFECGRLQGEANLELPPVHENIREVQMCDDDRRLYNVVRSGCRLCSLLTLRKANCHSTLMLFCKVQGNTLAHCPKR